jgi:hypothetical protein
MKEAEPDQKDKCWGRAWIMLTIAFALHAVDEAVSGFPYLYNSTTAALRERIGFLPLPVFTMSSFVAAMVIMLLFLFLATPFAYKQVKPMDKYSLVYAVIMFLNGTWHIIGSIVFGKWLPGVYSSPLLLIFAVLLFRSARGNQDQTAEQAS